MDTADEALPVTQERIRLLSEILDEELKVLAVEAEINEKTQKSVDENQRDYYLREQMKTIAEGRGRFPPCAATRESI